MNSSTSPFHDYCSNNNNNINDNNINNNDCIHDDSHNHDDADEGSDVTTNNTIAITQVGLNEVHIGKLLGTGSFASVYQVYPNTHRKSSANRSFQKMLIQANNNSIDLLQQQQNKQHFVCETVQSDDDDNEDDDDDKQQKQLSTDNNERTQHHRNQLYNYDDYDNLFVLKRARIFNNECNNNKERINECTYALKQEVDILTQLPEQHDNIIQLYGISTNFHEQPDIGFIILQYLPETLTDRLIAWNMNKRISKIKHPFKNSLSTIKKIFNYNKNNYNCIKRIEQNERLIQVGIGIANALSFLHDNNILYRDLKPSNIGFDMYGTVKLFDYGLSRKIIVTNGNNNSNYKLTACTGSWRYMAPEIALGKTYYSYPIDIYSLGIVMYEVCTLRKAYSNIHNINDMFVYVYIGTYRPPMKKRIIKCTIVQELLQLCWNTNPLLRPSLSYIINTLQNINNNNNNIPSKKKRNDKNKIK